MRDMEIAEQSDKICGCRRLSQMLHSMRDNGGLPLAGARLGLATVKCPTDSEVENVPLRVGQCYSFAFPFKIRPYSKLIQGKNTT